MSETSNLPSKCVLLPLLPLRDIVVFPHMVVSLFVGRPKSIKALEFAMASGKRIMLTAQKNPAKDELKSSDLYPVGCISNILQMLKLPDGTVKVLVEGLQRARTHTVEEQDAQFFCAAVPLDIAAPAGVQAEAQTEALRRTILAQFEQYIKLNKKIPAEILSSLASVDDAGRFTDTIAAHLSIKLDQKQRVLETFPIIERLEYLLTQIEAEIDILQIEKRIRGRVKRQMEKSQREYYLNEQVKAIQKELGEGEDGSDLGELGKRITAARMPKEAHKKAESELKKLRLMSPMSAEATVVRNYIDAMISLPWRKKSKTNHDLANAQTTLDEDHYGLEKVKERILEYLAVQQRVGKVKAPILCLVGPPGVGKTSLGQSIARATSRKFIRIALGGVRDEAEIRGHRRTYIGSMPGKILQNLAKAGVRNPLFLLDEVDKMGMDFRGDPASALLEVLDPEQNHTFADHYIEVDFDLSDVMFVATSNSLHIPSPLLDRMEVIRLSGYTEDEKVNIARRYLLPKQKRLNGLKEDELDLSAAALLGIIRYYTREAGVRSLEREISKICRKIVKKHLLERSEVTLKIEEEHLGDFLGVKKYNFGVAAKENQIGQVTGLAWTEVGGDLLTIEAALMPGEGKVIRTGSLGDVMKESVEAARSVVRSRAQRLGIADEIFRTQDIHIHVPEGATPKDGPSAGIAMATALVSILTGIPVRSDIAMTGEITLRGEVLPIGGLKEKLLAAHRGGIRLVIIPEENAKDLAEIADVVKNSIEIVPVRWIDRVLELALERMPEPQGINAPPHAVVPIPASESALNIPSTRTTH